MPSGSGFRPPRPTPQPQPLGPVALLRALARNPIECWAQAHFDEPIVMGGFPFARVAVVCELAAIRKILVEDPADFRKSERRRRLAPDDAAIDEATSHDANPEEAATLTQDLDTLERALASTQSQLDSTILGRDVGVRTSVDVLNAQQQVIQVRRDLQQVRYGYLLNTLRLKASAGRLSETDLEAVNRALGRG